MMNRAPYLQRIAAFVLAPVALSMGAGQVAHACDINVPDDHPTIHAAIAAAEPGDTICIEPGEYVENTLIIQEKDGVALLGAGSDQVTIIRVGGSYGLQVRLSDNVTLEGFTVQDADSSSFGYGLKLEHSDGLWVEDVHAIDNNRTGIDLNTTDNATLVDVFAGGNGGAGIAIRNSQDVTVINAGTYGNAWGGLALWAPTGETLANVSVSDSRFSGEPAGVFAQHSGIFTDISLEGNSIESNSAGIVLDSGVDATAFAITGNSIAGNDAAGVVNHEDNDPLQATDNWWGHASGPGGPDGRTNPAGQTVGKGDEIFGEVEFDPWLRRPID